MHIWEHNLTEIHTDTCGIHILVWMKIIMLIEISNRKKKNYECNIFGDEYSVDFGTLRIWLSELGFVNNRLQAFIRFIVCPGATDRDGKWILTLSCHFVWKEKLFTWADILGESYFEWKIFKHYFTWLIICRNLFSLNWVKIFPIIFHISFAMEFLFLRTKRRHNIMWKTKFNSIWEYFTA